MTKGAYYNENNKHAAQWIRNLITAGVIAPGEVDERSIVDVTADDLRGFSQCHFFAGIGVWSYALRRAGWPDDRKVWTGSCPCQPFSNAGKGGGHEDERHLWPVWERLIRECRPDSLFGEQVSSKDGLGWLDLVCTDLENQGYAVGAVDTCAAGVGAPHIRQRLWFVANAISQRVRRFGPRADACAPSEVAAEKREQRLRHDIGASGEFGRLADPIGPGLGIVGRGRCTATQDSRPHADHDHDGGMGNAGSQRLPSRECQELSGTRGGDEGRTTEQPGRSFWSDCEWVMCRDGKARPIEPGTFPLVAGSAFDLGSGSAFAGKSRPAMLKGYGNAIVAEVAIAFIQAAMK